MPLTVQVSSQVLQTPQRQQRTDAQMPLTVQVSQRELDRRRTCRRGSNRALALWQRLFGCLKCDRDHGDEHCRSNIRRRNESVLLIVQDRETCNAIVLMGTRAEFTRMRNGEYLSGQEQDYPEP